MINILQIYIKKGILVQNVEINIYILGIAIYIYDTYVEIDDDLQLNANINNVLVPIGHVSFNLMAFILDSSYLFYGLFSLKYNPVEEICNVICTSLLIPYF